MKYPEFLKEGGTIGFAAPSFGCSTEPYQSSFKQALAVFQDKGYRTLCGPNVYAGEGIGISNTPEKCGAEFMQMYLSPDADILLSCGGGEMMCEILDYVDFEVLKNAAPKWFAGYSDNTNLNFLLATICDTAAVYSPCAPSFGMQPWHPAIEDLWQLLKGEKLTVRGYEKYETESLKDEEHPLVPYNCTQPRNIIPFLPQDAAQASFSGRLIGGCIDCLVNLCGTCYDQVKAFSQRYAGDGFIWFLEACDLNVFAIRRAIWEMQHAGWFEHVNGFLIGRPLTGQEDLMGLDHIRAVTDLLAGYGVPILLDLDIGHLPPMMPLITGSMADVVWNRDGSRNVEISFRLV